MTTDNATPAAPVQRLVGRGAISGQRFIAADPDHQEMAQFGFYSTYNEALRRCKILNSRAGAPERRNYMVCQLFAVDPPNATITGPQEDNRDDG